MIVPHVERGRWWTPTTTRWLAVLIEDGKFGLREVLRCEHCGGSGYGLYGDGFRCHGCGRLVDNLDADGTIVEDDAALADGCDE